MAIKRSRRERWNGTWQVRPVADRRQAGIDNLEAAGEPAKAGSAFVSAAGGSGPHHRHPA
jgi:hypothetical protein